MDLPSTTDAATVASGLQASDITAIAGIVVAVCALGVSLWQTRKSHLHTLVNVKPVLDLPSATDNLLDSDEVEFSFYLSNNGLGPAKIRVYKYFIDDTAVNFDSLPPFENEVKFVLEQLNPPPSMVNTAASHKEGAIIKAGTESCLLKIKTKSEHSVRLRKELDRISMYIEYEDFFGNAQPPLDQRKRD